MSCRSIIPRANCLQNINSNTVLPSVSGLAANTTYLLVADGIENTKASFNLEFGGTVLPVKFQSFTGEAMPDCNQLKWEVEYSFNVKKLSLEKSEDGKNFTTIRVLEALPGINQYNDARPFTGNNYYRLAIENSDGSKEYSNIVLLARKERVFASIYPNPSNSFINIEMSTTEKGKYSFDLYNNTGQLVWHQNNNITVSPQLITLPVLHFAKGNYFLRISNGRNESIKNLSVVIN